MSTYFFKKKVSSKPEKGSDFTLIIPKYYSPPINNLN